MVEVTLRKAHDLALATRSASKAIKIERETTVSVHMPEPLAHVHERETLMLDRLQSKLELVRAYYELRERIGQANARTPVSASLTRHKALTEMVAAINDQLAAGERDVYERLMKRDSGTVAEGYSQAALDALPATLDVMRKRMDTVTSADVAHTVTVPALSVASVDKLRTQARALQQEASALLETVARSNVTDQINIDGDLYDTLRRHGLL